MLPRRVRAGSAAAPAALALLLLAALPAFAAGSANLYPAGASGFRANTEWRTNISGAGVAIRRTLLHAYAVSGEYLLMGSSAMGQGSADILVWNPGLVTGPPGNETIPGSVSFSCASQRAGSGDAAQGRITSRAEELAGPDTVPTGGVSNGYDPCWYQAPATGIYSVAVVGPAGLNSGADGTVAADVGLTNANDFSAAQGSSIAAWDLTVRGDLTDPSTTRTGRVFTYVLALFTGGNGLPVYSTTYVVTQDGYRYQVDDRGIDPNGWLQYANQVGFLEPDGVTPLDHDAVGAPGPELAALDGGVELAPPQYPMFFEPPADDTLTALGLPLTATSPNLSGVSFSGSESGSTSYYSTGGTFSFTASLAGVYQIVISRDGVNFDPTNPQNRLLSAAVPAGPSTVTWDGKDNSGNYFPSGATYPFQVNLHGGEYHFAFFDVENDVPGGPTITLLNAPGGVCPALNGGCHAGFYDDRGYTTTSGVDVGTPGAVLCGNDPPAVDHSDPTLGFDTSTDQRSFGAASGGNTNAPCTGSFGDDKDLDLWTYYPSQAQTSSLTIVPTADIAVADTVNHPTPDYGTDVTFTVTATDNGPENATGVALNDLLPSGLTYVSSTTTQGTYDSTTGVWTAGAINNGAGATLTITAQVASTAPMTDTATKTAEDQTDPVSSNNSASAGVDPQAADIAVTDTVDNATPNVGAQVTFTVTATNDGPDDATGVTVQDLLPAGITYVSDSETAGTYNSGTGKWTIGALSNGSSATLHITGTVTQSGALTDTATRSASAPPDPNPANDSASATVNGQPVADIGVTDMASNPTPALGTPVTFTVTATNHGPDDATGAVITDLLPPGLTYVSSTTTQGTYDSTTGVWTAGAINNGASAILTITATVEQAGILTDTASRSASSPTDPNPANDSASATVNGQAADIGVTDTVDHPVVATGGSATFTITATNHGPDDATGVVITDAVPAGFTLTGSSASVGTYDSTTGFWTIGPLADGASATLTLTGTVTVTTPVTDTATRTSSAPPDPNAANDQASATVNAPDADLAITLTGPAQLTAGASGEYVINVKNNGPTAASGPITVVDTLPSGMTYDGFSGSGWSCSGSGRTVTCTQSAALADGASEPTLTLDVSAPAAASSVSLVDVASVSSPTHDPVPANNAAAVTTQVQPAPTTPNTGAGSSGLTLGVILLLAGLLLTAATGRVRRLGHDSS